MIHGEVAIDNLGIKLHKHKLISEQQLFHAIATQKIKGGYLSRHLVELGYFDEMDLAAYIACHYGYPYLPLKHYTISKNAINVIDIDTMRTFYVLPIEKDNKILSIAMADPLNKGVLELIKRKTQCKIIIFISTGSEIKKTFEITYQTKLEAFNIEKYAHDNLKDDPIYNKECEKNIIRPSRRLYKRLKTDAIVESYSQASLAGKIINVSLNGILFSSDTFLSEGMQIPINIRLQEDKVILAVVEVMRCTPANQAETSEADGKTYYEIGATFNFLSDKDLKILADFLLSKIKKATHDDLIQEKQNQTPAHQQYYQ